VRSDASTPAVAPATEGTEDEQDDEDDEDGSHDAPPTPPSSRTHIRHIGDVSTGGATGTSRRVLTLHPRYLRRYGQLARLAVRYGRSDLVTASGLGNAIEIEPPDEQTECRPEDLARDLEELGPTFVKLGQLLSTRPDLVPEPYTHALARLRDDVDPIDWEEVVAVLEGEFGRPLETTFATVERHPLASASIAQVHRAQLFDGRLVAVKVQRPGIRQQVVDDLDALADLAEMLDRHTEIGRQYGFTDLLEEFRRSILAELDHELEASNLESMAVHLRRFEHLVVPQPVRELTTSRVLTMELVRGTTVTEAPLDLLGACGSLASELFEAYLEQILVVGFVHADPHPGNLLLTPRGDLALIDLGMVSHLDPTTRHQLAKLLVGIAGDDASEVSRVAASLGQPLDGYDERVLRRGVTEMMGRHRSAAVRDLGAGTIVMQLMQLAAEANLRLPSELSLVGKALLNLDEVTRTLDADFRPLDALQEFAPRLLREELGGSNTARLAKAALETREFLEQLPQRANHLLDSLGDGSLTIKVDAFDEDQLLREMEKVGNRLTTGLILAAIIIGAAMTMSVEAGPELLGYPAISIVFFVGAALGGLALTGYIVVGDRVRRRRARDR
jgi:ubiquinone biosynthesis protein